MAVKFKHVKDELEAAPLSTSEKQFIDILEKFIDEKILKDFDNRPIYIDTNYTEFRWNPLTNTSIDTIKTTRKKLMTQELYRRFEEAGWSCKVDINEGMHGGQDYWVLTGK